MTLMSSTRSDDQPVFLQCDYKIIKPEPAFGGRLPRGLTSMVYQQKDAAA